MTRLACLMLIAAAPAFASDPVQPLPPPPLPEPAVVSPARDPGAARARAAAPEASVAAERAVPERELGDFELSVKLALHIGLLTADVQVGHFYFFVAGNVGIPLLSNGQIGAFAGGPAFTFALSEKAESMWFMDLQALVNPGWISGRPFVGLGAGLGLRYLHKNGFTLAFKLPLLGGAIGASSGGTAEAVAYFYLANAIALPVVSLGYHF